MNTLTHTDGDCFFFMSCLLGRHCRRRIVEFYNERSSFNEHNSFTYIETSRTLTQTLPIMDCLFGLTYSQQQNIDHGVIKFHRNENSTMESLP